MFKVCVAFHLEVVAHFLSRLNVVWLCHPDLLTSQIFCFFVWYSNFNLLKPNPSDYYTLSYRPNLPFLISGILAL